MAHRFIKISSVLSLSVFGFLASGPSEAAVYDASTGVLSLSACDAGALGVYSVTLTKQDSGYVFALSGAATTTSTAYDSTYDPETGSLTIPSVEVGSLGSYYCVFSSENMEFTLSTATPASSDYTVTVGSGTYSYTIDGVVFSQDYPVYDWNSAKNGLSGIDTGSVSIELGDVQEYGGHYYRVAYVPTGNVSWIQAAYLTDQLGGHLACPNDSAENSFLFGLVDDGVDTVSTIVYDSSGNVDVNASDVANDGDDKYFAHFDIHDPMQSSHHDISIGPFLGGFQPDGSSEPSGNWRCLDGTALTDASGNTATYTNWAVDLYCDSSLDPGCMTSISDSTNTDLDYRINNQPNDSADGQPFMGFGEMNKPVATWGDYSGTVGEYGTTQRAGDSHGFIMEFDSMPEI